MADPPLPVVSRGPLWVKSGRCKQLTIDVRFTPKSRHLRPSVTWSASCQNQTLGASQSIRPGWTMPPDGMGSGRIADATR
jgi:hypothetical protein